MNTTTLPRNSLIPSPTNPRKRKGLDVASLTELAQTMRPPIGILSSILVRELIGDPGHGNKYEIIAGERRWRAAEIAGLTEVPVKVIQLSDLEVLKIQLIENKQREDLDELEEAEGYEKLMQQTDANGTPYTKDMIADIMGVSRSTIYSRLKLLTLCAEAREAFYAGELDASTALLIARIPVHKLQIQAVKKITVKAEYNSNTVHAGEKTMSYRAARDLIQREYMTNLDRAMFAREDASLLDRVGACTDCQERTGNQPGLFDDVGDADVCTNTVCFGLKQTAHILAVQKKAEEEGCIVIIGNKAKKLIPNPTWSSKPAPNTESGYERLDSKCPHDPEKTWEQVLASKKLLTPAKGEDKPAVQKVLIENTSNHELIPTVNIEAATKALREAGFEITLKGKEPARGDDKQNKDREKAKQELVIENTFRARLFDTLHTRIESDMFAEESQTFPMLYRMMAVGMMSEIYSNYPNESVVDLIKKYTTHPTEQEREEDNFDSYISKFSDNIPNLTSAQHLMFIIELTLMLPEIHCNYHTSKATTMLALASELGIDADGLRKEAAAEHKATAAAAKKATAKKAPKAAPAEPSTNNPEQTKARPVPCWPFPVPA